MQVVITNVEDTKVQTKVQIQYGNNHVYFMVYYKETLTIQDPVSTNDQL